MNPYYALLYNVWTHQPCTRFHLEHLESGKFKDQIDTCIQLNYIYSPYKNENGDALYYVTDSGRKLVEKPKEEGRQ